MLNKSHITHSVVIAAAILLLVAVPVHAATTGWNVAAPGSTYSYTDTANWVGGTINDTFDASLSLTDDNTNGSQTLLFAADYTTAGLLNFAYTDANTTSVAYNFTLVADGSADRTLNLGGNLTFAPVRNTRLLTIGSATTGSKLAVNLGGARTFNITTATGTITGSGGADPGSGVTLLNAVSGGTITKTGTGWLRLGGGEANTLTGLTVSGGVVRLQKTANVDAVGGDITINGGTLLLNADGQIPNGANVTLSSGAFYYAATGSTASGNTPRSETVNDLTISGGTFNTSPKSNGSVPANSTDAVLGTMSVSGSASVTIRNTAFTANRLQVTGTTVNVNSVAGSGLDAAHAGRLIIGSGGLEITNNASGAYAPISMGNWGLFRLGGNVTFTGNGSNTNTVTISAATNQGGGAQDLRTFSLEGGARTFTVNDGAADIDLALDPDFTITNTSSTGTGSIVKTGTGTMQIGGVHTFSGGVTVSQGTLLISGGAAAASSQAGTTNGTTTVTGLTSTSGLVVGQVVSGTGVSTGTTIASIVSSTSITLSSAATAGTPTLTFAAGSGTGTGAVSVTGGTLAGTGGAVGAVTVSGTGTLAPGPGIGSFATGAATFGDGSTLAVDVGAAAASDKLVVTGNLDLSSLLDTLTVSGTTDGSTYTIASYTGTLTGVFDTPNLPGGYTIDYGSGSNSAITLSPVPEPTGLAVLILAGGTLLKRRKRQVEFGGM